MNRQIPVDQLEQAIIRLPKHPHRGMGSVLRYPILPEPSQVLSDVDAPVKPLLYAEIEFKYDYSAGKWMLQL